MNKALFSLSSAVLGVAMTLGLAAGAVTSITLPAQAQGQEHQGNRGNWGQKLAQELNLTTEQQAQLRQIHESTRQRLQAVLTPEQRSQMTTARAAHRRPELTLTDAQKTQMREIRESAKQQMQAVLTPEQQARWTELRQQQQQQRQQRSEGSR